MPLVIANVLCYNTDITIKIFYLKGATYMGNMYDVIEAVYVPHTDDNGFFNYFEKVAMQMPAVRRLGRFKACNEKPKCILVNYFNRDVMWICHYLTNIHNGQSMEYVHRVDTRTGKIEMCFSDIPQPTIRRKALSDLWVLLSLYTGVPTSEQKTEHLQDTICQRSDGEFSLDLDPFPEVYSFSGSYASLKEIVEVLTD